MIGAIAGWLVKSSLASGGALTMTHARRIAKLGVVLAVVALIALLAYCTADKVNDTVETITETAEENGARGAVVAGQNQTLEQLGDANDAEDDLRAGGERSAARYDDCMLDSRDKASCERYNPDPVE